MQAKFRQGLPGAEVKIADNKVAFLRGKIRFGGGCLLSLKRHGESGDSQDGGSQTTSRAAH
jgi:hypothetical protein